MSPHDHMSPVGSPSVGVGFMSSSAGHNENFNIASHSPYWSSCYYFQDFYFYDVFFCLDFFRRLLFSWHVLLLSAVFVLLLFAKASFVAVLWARPGAGWRQGLSRGGGDGGREGSAHRVPRLPLVHGKNKYIYTKYTKKKLKMKLIPGTW